MNPIEIQQAIDDENWDALDRADSWDFGRFLDQEGALFKKSILLDFFGNGHGNQITKFIDVEMVDEIFSKIDNLTIEDYEELLKKAHQHKLIDFLNLTKHKTQVFLEFYIDNFEEITDLINAAPRFGQNISITQELLGDGSLNEKFAELINDASVMRQIAGARLFVDAAGLNFFEDYISSEAKLGFLDNRFADDAVIQDIINNLSEETIMEYIYAERQRPLDIKFSLSNLEKNGYSFNDENIKKMLYDAPQHVPHIMTKEQIFKFKDEIGINAVRQSSKLTLDDLAELFPGKRASAPPSGFHTEEEILKYPQFFNPKSSAMRDFYFTRETLKVLNSFWGTRQRYDAKSSDVTYVLIENIYIMTSDTIRYLTSKGEVDWVCFYKELDNPVTTSNTTSAGLAVVSDLIRKYK